MKSIAQLLYPNMKTKNIKILICSLSMVLILCLSLLGGCNKRELNTGKGKGDILPLIGTTWKLAGFANTKHDSIESAEASGNNVYLLIFKDDGSISGTTSTNLAGGKFVLSNKEGELSITWFSNLTEVNELFDDSPYIDAMNKVSSYHISPKGLSLYYGKDTYLLFRPVEQ